MAPTAGRDEAGDGGSRSNMEARVGVAGAGAVARVVGE